MQVYPYSKSKKLNIICRELSQIINSPEFYEILNNFGEFEFSSDFVDGKVDGKEVAEAFKNCKLDARIVLYRPWWIWSKVNAYYNPSKGYELIFVNSRRFYSRNYASCAETILHEIIHLVDFWDKSQSFGHGSNSPIGKSESAPWKISRTVIDELFHII